MATVTRTVRFQPEEAKLINKFLEKNPILDFSTLARLAITSFIKKPNLQLIAVETKLHTSVHASNEALREKQ